MSKNKREAAPYSLRLTREERQVLEEHAGHMPVSAYIRACLFEAPTPRRNFCRISKDQDVFLKLLHELSQSRISSNLNQLAKAYNQGCLPLGEETENALQEACTDIAEMRKFLLSELGIGKRG